MTPDIEQHLELLVGILAVTLAILHRLLKRGRNGHVSLLLTVSDTEKPSKNSQKNREQSQVNGRKADLQEPCEQHTKKPEGD